MSIGAQRTGRARAKARRAMMKGKATAGSHPSIHGQSKPRAIKMPEVVMIIRSAALRGAAAQ
jgi:hypothetical protein